MVEEVKRKRGGCLAAFLIFMIIANALSSLSYFFAGSAVRTFMPGAPAWSIIVFGLVSLLNVIFAFGIWKYRKWGFYGFAASSLVTFALNLIVGVPVYSAILGFIGVLILYFLVRPIWNQME